jgi:predicted chitinase
MKKLLLLILFVLNLVLLQAQEVKFISVNEADTSLENITFKRLPKLLQKGTLRPDTLTAPAKWMLKLQKKLSKQQHQDFNIYIFFCPSAEDSVKAFLPISGKYGYVLFDTAKTSVEEIQALQKRLCTWKYQWDAIHNPGWHLFGNLFQSADEGAMKVTKATPVAIISDTTMTEGKVFVYKGTDNKMKVKFESSDTSKTKITYKLTTLIETTKTTLTYPKTGYDTLIYNQAKEITLDSIPEGKYTLLCKLGSTEYKTTFYIRKQKFEVTVTQLQSIFTKTDSTRIKEVVKAINENSLLYGINTPERMAHFIGQIGAETGGLKKLKEDCNYTAKNIFNTFLKPNLRSNSASKTGKTFKYCDLVEGYTCTNLTSCDGTNTGHSDCDSAISVKLTKSNTCAWEFVNFDSTYNVKSSYISNSTLFDYVYGCRMDNGAKSTQDGSTYLGKGFIHITGKSGYKALSIEWNKLYPNDQKEFHGKDITLLETDVEVAIKASMVFWKIKNLNSLADKGVDDTNINKVGAIVNGTNPPNGEELRKQYSKAAHNNIK